MVYTGQGKQESATLTLKQGQESAQKVNVMNLSQLPPQKKRVLAIGLVAFVVLLFVSFLLSLLEDDKSSSSRFPEDPQVLEETSDGLQLKKPQVPSSQQYDFNQEPESTGLENLLNGDQEFGVDSNPFSNMQGQGTLEPPKYGPNTTNAAEEEDQATVEELSIPAPEPVMQFTLYCDEYATAQEAESQKAVLAFQGITSTVVESSGKYRLKIGPYPTKDEARAVFNDFGKKGLVSKCSLISSPN